MPETLIQFTERLCKDVECYSHKNPSRNAYSIKKHNSIRPKYMGVFGWVSERKEINSFRISTYNDLAIKAGVNHLATKTAQGAHWGNSTGLIFYVKNHSNSSDYQNALKALRAILPFVP